MENNCCTEHTKNVQNMLLDNDDENTEILFVTSNSLVYIEIIV